MSNEIQGYEAYSQTIVVINTLSVIVATLASGIRRGLAAGGLTLLACMIFGMVWLFVMGAIAVILDRFSNRAPLAALLGIKNIGLILGPVAVAFVIYPL